MSVIGDIISYWNGNTNLNSVPLWNCQAPDTQAYPYAILLPQRVSERWTDSSNDSTEVQDFQIHLFMDPSGGPEAFAQLIDNAFNWQPVPNMMEVECKGHYPLPSDIDRPIVHYQVDVTIRANRQRQD